MTVGRAYGLRCLRSIAEPKCSRNDIPVAVPLIETALSLLTSRIDTVKTVVRATVPKIVLELGLNRAALGDQL